MAKSRFSEDEILSILKEYEIGKSIIDICKEYNISVATFYLWKRKHLVQFNHKENQKFKIELTIILSSKHD